MAGRDPDSRAGHCRSGIDGLSASFDTATGLTSPRSTRCTSLNVPQNILESLKPTNIPTIPRIPANAGGAGAGRDKRAKRTPTKMPATSALKSVMSKSHFLIGLFDGDWSNLGMLALTKLGVGCKHGYRSVD